MISCMIASQAGVVEWFPNLRLHDQTAARLGCSTSFSCVVFVAVSAFQLKKKMEVKCGIGGASRDF